jgi:hypothetical protein
MCRVGQNFHVHKAVSRETCNFAVAFMGLHTCINDEPSLWCAGKQGIPRSFGAEVP